MLQARKMLMVSYHFPPSLAARGLQIGKLVKYVTALGVEIDMITLETQRMSNSVKDLGLDRLEERKTLMVYRCREEGFCLRDRLSSAVFSLPFPRWSRRATDLALELLATDGVERYCCIMTCAHPMDSHWVGLEIKKRYPNLLWLAHFSDPWATNPMANPLAPWQKPLKRRFEKHVMETADSIIFPCESLLKFVMRNYPSRSCKAKVLPHIFDPGLYEEPKAASNDFIRITYVGGLNKRRNIRPLIVILRRLKQRGTKLERLRFKFVGGETVVAANLLNSIHPGVANSVGRVGYLESLKLMQQASCLLLVEANFKESPYFPSKLADYFGARRPVLGITPSNSCSTGLLKKLGMPVFDYSHLDDCARYITGVLEGSIELPAVAESGVRCYSAPHVARQFVDMVTKLTVRT